MLEVREKQIKSYKDLLVWQKAYDLALKVYKLTSAFPAHEKYALVQQIRRATVSIPSNIAEGNTRNHSKEYVQFLYVALGSKSEVETQLMLAKDLGYITAEDHESSLVRLSEIGKMLNGLISVLKGRVSNN